MTKTNSPNPIHSEYESVIDEIARLSPDKYYDAVFRFPMEFYRKRLRMIGATGLKNVLDAGHGFGQWSVALAEANDQVEAVDHNQPRCDISLLLKKHYNVENMSVHCGPLDDLENMFEAESFDMIWCWGVIMFCNRSGVMPVFHKILKPGGLLVLGAANTPQRWQYKYDKGKRDGLDNPNFYKFCEQGINGLDQEVGVNAFGVNVEENAPIAERYGFEVVEVDYDGHIRNDGEEPLLFEPEVNVEDQNVEVVFRKPLGA